MKRIIHIVYLLILVLALSYCGSTPEKDQILVGEWTAEWKTSPESFPEVDGIENFSMNGRFNFSGDGKVTISAVGVPGCIFSSDTHQHSLNWLIQNDTLSLKSDDDPYGIPYNITLLNEKTVELKLMEDITLTLNR